MSPKRRGGDTKPPSRATAPSPFGPSTTSQIPEDLSAEQVEAFPEEAPPAEEAAPTTPRKDLKIAIILGPGGMRAYAHAGALQEILQAKLPVQAIGGLEWGALPAALTARKGLPFEAEWQMMKLKEEDLFERSLLGEKSFRKKAPVEDLIQRLIGADRVEQSQMSFACSSYNLQKQKAYIMERGQFKNLLPFCLAFPPLMSPLSGSVGDPTQVQVLADHFRTKGANFIVYIDTLSEMQGLIKNSLSQEGIQWAMVQQSIERQLRSVDFVLSVPTSGAIDDFNRRREHLVLGRDVAKRELPNLLRKISGLGFTN